MSSVFSWPAWRVAHPLSPLPTQNETLSQTDAITLERAVTALQQVGTAQYALPEGVHSVGDEPQEKTKKKHRKEGEKKRRHAEGDDGKSAKKEKKEKKKRKHD